MLSGPSPRITYAAAITRSPAVCKAAYCTKIRAPTLVDRLYCSIISHIAWRFARTGWCESLHSDSMGTRSENNHSVLFSVASAIFSRNDALIETSQVVASAPPSEYRSHCFDEENRRKRRRSAGSKVFRNALSSTLGASVVAAVVTPLDVVKVRLQAHVCPVGGHSPCEDPKHVEGSLDAARKILRSEGVRGLWRGLNVTLLLAIPTTGLYFTLYEAFRERIGDTFPGASTPAAAIGAGAAARIAASSAASPLELARTSLQAGVGGPNATVFSVLKYVRKHDGMLAWWRGLGPTLLRDAPFSAIYWSTYETLKDPQRSILPKRMFHSGTSFGVYLSAGIGAGGLAAMCTVPADVVKTRRQSSFVRGPDGRTVAPTAFTIAKQIIRDDGVRGLFRGAGPRIAKVAPACAIMMGSYEIFRKLFGGT